MWHEARKQERKIRGLLVDYRKRAERRQDFYEKIKADPTQFIQIHGRKCRIHLDPAIAAAGESPAIMMPWQGMHDNMIDRFDGRAYLDPDRIPQSPKAKDLEEICSEERQCNYERYRILAQNDFLAISEEKFLHQLHMEEQFGINAQLDIDKPKKKTGGVAIGYTYDDSNDQPQFPSTTTYPQVNAVAPIAGVVTTVTGIGAPVTQMAKDEESDSDLDVDVAIDISKIDTAQAHELNGCGRHYGMKSNDFYSFLTKDADEADALKIAREEEQEKIMLSGRKSRRERRAQRERRFAGRPISPPSYAAKEEPAFKDEDSPESRSPSPENSGKITYITSFGGDDELQPHMKIQINFNKSQNQATGGSGQQAGYTIIGQPMSYADKVRENLGKLGRCNSSKSSTSSSGSPKKPLAYQRRSYTRSRSRSHSWTRRSSYNRHRRGRHASTRSHSHSRSRRNHRPTKSRSSSRRGLKHRQSQSRSRDRRKYSRSRSRQRRTHRRYSSSSSTMSSTTTSSSTSTTYSSRSRSKSRASLSRITSKDSSIPTDAINKPLFTSIVPKDHLSPEKISVQQQESPPPPSLIPSLLAVPILSLPSQLENNMHLQQQQQQQQQLPVVSIVQQEEVKLPEPQVPIKKYYGRKRDDQSSSDEELNLNDDNAVTEIVSSDRAANNNASSSLSTNTTKLGKQSTTVDTKKGLSTGNGRSGFNPRDRLKRKMQILLNKQYKLDKLAEIEKTERQVQQQQEREDEMRELALRLRKRQRELRHKYGTPTSSQSDENSDPNSDDNEQDRELLNNKKSNGSPPKLSHHHKRTTNSRSQSRSSFRSRSQSRTRSKSKTFKNRGDHDYRSGERIRDRMRDRLRQNHSRSRSKSNQRHYSRDCSQPSDYDHRKRSDIRDMNRSGRDRYSGGDRYTTKRYSSNYNYHHHHHYQSQQQYNRSRSRTPQRKKHDDRSRHDRDREWERNRDRDVSSSSWTHRKLVDY